MRIICPFLLVNDNQFRWSDLIYSSTVSTIGETILMKVILALNKWAEYCSLAYVCSVVKTCSLSRLSRLCDYSTASCTFSLCNSSTRYGHVLDIKPSLFSCIRWASSASQRSIDILVTKDECGNLSLQAKPTPTTNLTQQQRPLFFLRHRTLHPILQWHLPSPILTAPHP